MRKTRPWMMLLLALASGALAAALALRYLRQQATPLMAAEPKRTQIVVAAKSLPVGAVIGPQDVKLVSWVGDALPPGYATSPAQVVGRGIITPVVENEPLLEGKIAAKEAGGGLPIIIKDGMRAISVKVDEVIGVAGFVLPGTRVDVLLTLPEDEKKGRPQPITKTILQNIQALAAGQSVQRDAEGKPMTVSVVTLLVSPEEAEILALATKEGRLQLALRNTLDTLAAPVPGARADQFALGSRPAPRVSTNRVRTPPPVAAPAPPATVVEGYRGGERTLTTFRNP